ncbi:TonB-dependent receptor [Barnesiella viscericola]|uniref:TonB-dependent receptor n=1 Tax=Barnesiella viscericola TaxID=397865 RepID=A0A921SVB8_9BACT|nr:TonB-dependent receptor [Barnesiella viscericola]
MLQWFDQIEKQCGITLSYNPSAIDLNQVCTFKTAGTTTVGKLLKLLLKEYTFKTTVIPPRKLVIQVGEEKFFTLSGTICEEGSSEKLYGAIVSLYDPAGKRQYTLSDENGRFKLPLPEGEYRLVISCMGYEPYEQTITADRDLSLTPRLKALLYEIDEVTVKSHKLSNSLNELAPSSLLSFSSNDLFSQIWILPGVTGIPTGNNFLVDGGGYDENQLLLDGVPVYHPGHLNLLLPMFNGDAVKNIVFHKGFFPTKLEGKLSSITEVNLKDGNKQEHMRTLSLDMPAASVMLEGPIIKNKLSYLVSARRSWLDLFDEFLSEEDLLNHSTLDFNAKLSYDISPSSSLKALAYNARDNYRLPIGPKEKISVLRWNNQIYQLAYNFSKGKLSNTTSIFYTSYTNIANANMLGFETDTHNYIHSGIKSLNISTEFSYSYDNIYTTRWGAKYDHEVYDLAVFGDTVRVRHEPIDQFSIFYDNLIRITSRLFTQVGVHFIGYLPEKHRDYYSIQPRFSLKYSPWDSGLFYLNFSRMEQFYHYLRFNTFFLPTDFRMPSIESYKPRSSEHYEAGWKHNLRNGSLEVSGYYKTRRNIVALRPETFVEDTQWSNYIMTGNGDSYGIKCYFYNYWHNWLLQLSYTYARSREWFDELKANGKLPSLYDIPHQLNGAISYTLGTHSIFSLGGLLRSGKVLEIDEETFDPYSIEEFRKKRAPLNYRVDAGYCYKQNFGDDKLLLLRVGLYNIVGNPPEEEILDFYSVHWPYNCMPYGSISFRF